jgi:hypothetical protein
MFANRQRTSDPARSGGAYSFGPDGQPRRARQVSGSVAKVNPGRPTERDRLSERRSELADDVTQLLAKRRYADALASIQRLVMLDPTDPRWHQKHGEVLRTLGRNREAAAAYRVAARRYEALALPARSSAAYRVAESLEGVTSTPPSAPVSAPVSARPTSTDRQPSQPLLPIEDRITARPPWK